jgi:glutathione synthase
MATKPLRVGIVMDPIESITPYKDSSLAMLLEAERRKAEIHYFNQSDLKIVSGTALGRSRRLNVDPPFDMEYIYTTYILDRARYAGALIMNDPEALRNMNEKAFTAWFPDCVPDTLITRSMDEMRAFLAEHGHVVIKPLGGMGGRSIFVIRQGDKNANVVFETLTDYGQQFAMAQTYIPEISLGDKRILLFDGEPVPYALARIDVIGDYLTEVNVTSPTGMREIDKQFNLNTAGLMFDAIERRLGRNG